MWKTTDTEIQIISTKGTPTKLYLGNLAGYNNGVKILDDICGQVFMNSTLKSKGATGRNLKLSDIVGDLEEGGTKTPVINATATNSNTNDGGHQSMPNEGYTSGTFPKIFVDNENNIKTLASREVAGATGTNYLGTQSSTASSSNKMQPYATCWYNTSMSSSSFTSTAYYNMVMGTALGNDIYWLSTRWAAPSSYSYCTFGLEFVRSSGVSTIKHVYYSNGDSSGDSCAVRPLVSIPKSAATWTNNSDTQLTISY